MRPWGDCLLYLNRFIVLLVLFIVVFHVFRIGILNLWITEINSSGKCGRIGIRPPQHRTVAECP